MNQPHRLEAVHPWHEDIDDEQVKALRLEALQPGSTVVDGFDCVTCALEQDFDRGENCPIVIDDENARHVVP
jgi:hypothetical protein